MKHKILLIFIHLFLINTLNSQPEIELQEFAMGFDNPLGITHAGDSRLFVVEQQGYIQILDADGNLLETPFLDISGRVKSGGEQGLLGLVFHPDYKNNGYFYVNYTDQEDSTHIARFSVDESDSNLALPNSEYTIMTIFQPYTNHNAGDLAFGPDGYLYIGTGDGGSGGDPGNRAQDSLSLLGKMLRIDVDGSNPYTIPEDNPFAGLSNVRGEIWALGLRNPWRYSFDSQTGDLWIADVGQNQYEEIDLQAASSGGGENYGWRCYEGNHEYNTNGCLQSSFYTFPVHEYSHDETGGCSVTGGYVYRGDEYPGMQGHYFFADYCNDMIRTLYEESGEWKVSSQGEYPGNNFSAFGESVDKKLYIAGLSSGIIYEIRDKSSGTGYFEKGKDELKIFPNPFKDQFSLKINNPRLKGSRLKIFNHAGIPVRDFRITKENERIRLDNLQPGLYILKIESEVFSRFHKLIKTG
ncbi:MAG: PQQ-dependent sugar dehydrogenase [Bacteroidales bacterium]|nr:PQQ-dependent sugar dehydrogenase [Bacteroidales bacterium]MCF8398703.1 PQQ-dependent sugar dehydrogenase [Bacteroidales bacterium]